MANTVKSRIISTHDVEDVWNTRVAFVPKKGEIIVYDPDVRHPYSRFKIGDGLTALIDLPFTIASGISDFLSIKDDICYVDGGNILEYGTAVTDDNT